jgi:hypothetical protein
MNNTIVISSSRMAGWLMFNRMNLLSIRPDLKHDNRIVFLFSNTSELQLLMTKYNEVKNNI